MRTCLLRATGAASGHHVAVLVEVRQRHGLEDELTEAAVHEGRGGRVAVVILVDGRRVTYELVETGRALVGDRAYRFALRHDSTLATNNSIR